VAAADRLRSAQNQLEEVQARVTQIQQQNTLAYVGFAMQIPSVVSNIYGMVKALSLAKVATEAATVAQWLHAKALVVTHALSGPAGWAILGVAAAVTAGSLAWVAMNQQQQNYNKTVDETIDKTNSLLGLEAELGKMSPLERLQREYSVVKRYYETAVTERREVVTAERRETTGGLGGGALARGGEVNVSIGRIEVSAGDLGSPFDRDRAAEDLAEQLAKKVTLKVIGR